jgi:hypothetical protein
MFRAQISSPISSYGGSGMSYKASSPKLTRRVTTYTSSYAAPPSSAGRYHGTGTGTDAMTRTGRPLPNGPGPLDHLGRKMEPVSLRPKGRTGGLTSGPVKADHSQKTSTLPRRYTARHNDWLDEEFNTPRLDPTKKTRSVSDLSLASSLDRMSVSGMSGNSLTSTSKYGNFGSQSSLRDIGVGRRDSSGSGTGYIESIATGYVPSSSYYKTNSESYRYDEKPKITANYTPDVSSRRLSDVDRGSPAGRVSSAARGTPNVSTSLRDHLKIYW